MSKATKATLGLMIVTMLSKVLGFIRETVLVATHGVGATADAYITAMSIPGVIFATIGAALATTFIPLFFEIEKEKGSEKALNFANNIFNIVIVLSIVLSITGYIFAEPLIKLFAIKFEGDKLLLATEFTRTMIFGMLFIGLNNIMKCWLQIKGNFTIAGMTGLPYNVIIIVSIILSSGGNMKILAIGTLIAMSSEFFFLLPFAYKQGYRYKFNINIKDKYIKEMLYLIIPVFIGIGVNQINAVVDRSLASTLGDGIITILNSANRLNGFVIGLFIITIATVVYPMLSKLTSSGDSEKFADTIKQCVNSVVILIIPISVGAIILAEPVVRIVFERGKFDAQDTKMTAIALIFYSLGMIGVGLRDILNKVFYSLKDTKTPMMNGALAIGINIVLNIILIQFMGHAGSALATSLSAIICILLLFGSLKKKIGYFGQDKILRTFTKSILSAGIMGIVIHFLYIFLSGVLGVGTIQEIVVLIGSIGVGVLVYGILVLVLKVEEVYMILDMFKKKLKIS